MRWKLSLAAAFTTLCLTAPTFAQSPGGPSVKEPRKGSDDSGSGNRPPGTPSWGDKGTPTTKNPTAPCPAGTSRQKLGQDCQPLDKQGERPKK